KQRHVDRRSRPCPAIWSAQPRTPRAAPAQPESLWRAPQHSSGSLALELSIALGFELKSEFLAARLDHTALRQHVHHIRHYVIEQPLIVGDNDHRAFGRAQSVH